MTSSKPSAFNRKVKISPELAKIVGNVEITRPEITKKVWDHIKKKGLQDIANKRIINPDELLSKVLGSDKPIDMFKLTSEISKHIT